MSELIVVREIVADTTIPTQSTKILRLGLTRIFIF